MNFKKMILNNAFAVVSLTSGAAILLTSSLAFSGGYEKPNSFSGLWSGLGGAAASQVTGAEALYFNPAGLAGGNSTFEFSGNFAPTSVSFSGPIAGNAGVNSSSSFIPAFGVFASYKINPKWGVGIGTYLSGGAKAVYNGVDFTNSYVPFGGANNPALANSSSTIQSNLSIVEFSIGTGYEVLDGLRFGFDYRLATVHGALSSFGLDPIKNTLTTVTVDGISGTAYNGFRLGAQYYPKESRWGIGAQWRSEVAFTGTGNISGAVTAATANSAFASAGAVAGTQYTMIPGNTATVSNSFPQQFDLGGHYDLIPNGLRAHLQYTFTNYSVNQSLAVVGTASVSPVAGVTVSNNLNNIDQNWNNEHDLRLGFDCFELQGWVFRASYVLSSAVTPKDRARAVFTAPGLGHTFAVGAGTSWLANLVETNLTLEYGFTSADTTGQGITPSPDKTEGAEGKYTASDVAAYLGVTVRI